MVKVSIRNILYTFLVPLVPLLFGFALPFGFLVNILLLSYIANLIYYFFSKESQSPIFTKNLGKSEREKEEDTKDLIDSNQKFKDLIFYRLKSPLTLIGIAVVVFTTIVAAFPQILTPLTLDQAVGIYFNAWKPPSTTHPLGQTKFGQDVLAILAYGVSTLMTVCILPVLIGFVIGIFIFYLSKVHRWVKKWVLGFMIYLLIISSIALTLLLNGIWKGNIIVTMSVMTLLMISWVTILVRKGNYSLKLILKKLFVYLPLFVAFNMILLETIGILEISDPLLRVQLGYNISRARPFMFIAPWASFWPSLALYTSIMGFLALHYGLKESIPISNRS